MLYEIVGPYWTSHWPESTFRSWAIAWCITRLPALWPRDTTRSLQFAVGPTNRRGAHWTSPHQRRSQFGVGEGVRGRQDAAKIW